MSQKKNFIKIYKVCDVGNCGIDSSRRIFFICWNFTHTIRLRRYDHGRSFLTLYCLNCSRDFFFVHHRTASDGIPDRGYRGAGIRACQCLCGAFPHQPAGTVGHSVLEDGGKCVRQL